MILVSKLLKYKELTTTNVNKTALNLLEGTRYLEKAYIFMNFLNDLDKNNIDYMLFSGFVGSCLNEDENQQASNEFNDIVIKNVNNTERMISLLQSTNYQDCLNIDYIDKNENKIKIQLKG